MHRILTVTAVTLLAASAVAPAQSSALDSVRARWLSRIGQVPGAEVAISYRDLGSCLAIDINAASDFHAASTMKVPVMLEVLRDVDAGRL